VHNQLNSLATLNIGGGEIILILVILFILAVVAVVFFGLIYLLVRAVQNRPAPVPSTLAQDVLLQNQQDKDREHLRLLSIFHFVVAGLALFGIAFLFVHYFIMHTAFSNPDMWKGQQNAALPPKAFLDAFVWFYVFMGAIFLIGMVLNVISAVFLWQKRHRVFSTVVAGLNCLQIPFGTALGVFTIIVLSRDSVRELYCGNSHRS